MLRHLSRSLLAVAAVVVALLAVDHPAPAQETARFALLIGNQGYAEKVGPLKNPHNDVALVGEALTRLGFKVTVRKDATYRDIDTAVKRHISDVRKGGTGTLIGARHCQPRHRHQLPDPD